MTYGWHRAYILAISSGDGGSHAVLEQPLRLPECANCARSEVSAIDKPTKPSVKVQDTIENAKAYCKQNPDSFVSLRDYSNGVYNQTCAAFAAEQQAVDPTYKIGSD